MEIKDWDTKGKYEAVVTAVKSVGENARVFRTQQQRTRVGYWVLTVDMAEGRVAGLMVEAVES